MSFFDTSEDLILVLFLQEKQTRVIKECLEPLWDEEFDFTLNLESGPDCLLVQVTILGRVSVRIMGRFRLTLLSLGGIVMHRCLEEAISATAGNLSLRSTSKFVWII